MYDLTQLCRQIHMPAEVTEIILSEEKGDVSAGFRELTDHLNQACAYWDEYLRLGISEQIFIDTMACFSRFVGEHMVSFGCYGFDRSFWTVRQISGKLFRIGELEYELLVEEGRNLVSLHIPSDARLQLPLLRNSYLEAKSLIDRTFPDFANVPYVCGSWLLSPNLKDLLPSTSNILKFQQSFMLTGTFADQSFKEWVYKRTDIPDADLPENTTLQRSLKAFLLDGGIFHSGEGTLIDEPFT